MPNIHQLMLLFFPVILTFSGASVNKIAVADVAKPLSSNQTVTKLESGQISIQNDQTKQAFTEISDSLKQTQNRVRVFFPKSPKSDNDLSYVEAVSRNTQRRDLPQYAIEQLIVGPNSNEVKSGFSKALQVRGNSNCGKDFTLSISKGVARLKFCKQVPSGGIGDDARAKSSLEATLKQFPTVKSVIILTKEGDCLGDMSGENFCLRSNQNR